MLGAKILLIHRRISVRACCCLQKEMRIVVVYMTLSGRKVEACTHRLNGRKRREYVDASGNPVRRKEHTNLVSSDEFTPKQIEKCAYAGGRYDEKRKAVAKSGLSSLVHINHGMNRLVLTTYV